MNYIDNKKLFDEIIKCKARKTSSNEWGDCISPKLAEMITQIVFHLAESSNFRYYTFKDEMIGDALLLLVGKWMKFNEKVTDKAFNYYSTIAYRAFVTRITKEKQGIDYMHSCMLDAGFEKTFNEQVEDDFKNQSEDS